MVQETIFTMDTSSIMYGPGATREVGAHMERLGARRVMVVTDPEPGAARAGRGGAGIAAEAAGIDAVLFDRVRVEPTDASFQEAIDVRHRRRVRWLRRGRRRLESSTPPRRPTSTRPIPADFLTYVNAADRRGASRCPAAQAADRDPDDGRHRQRDDRRRDLRPTWSCTPKPASPTARCGPVMGIVDPDNTRRCRRWSPPAPGSTSSATRSSR